MTLISILMVMVGYFLLLYSEVGFIQSKKLASSAHPDILKTIPESKKRFKGAHALGWTIAIIGLSLMIGAFALAIWVERGMSFLIGGFWSA